MGAPLLEKVTFRVHRRIVSAGRQALHVPGRKTDERFTRMGAYFF